MGGKQIAEEQHSCNGIFACSHHSDLHWEAVDSKCKAVFLKLSKLWDHWSSREKECFPILWVFDLVLLVWGQTIFISNKFPGDIDTTFGYPTLKVSGLQQQWQLFGLESQDNDHGNYFYVLPQKNYSEL